MVSPADSTASRHVCSFAYLHTQRSRISILVTGICPQDEANCVGAWSTSNQMTEVRATHHGQHDSMCLLFATCDRLILDPASLLGPEVDGSGLRATQITNCHIGVFINFTRAVATTLTFLVRQRLSSKRHAMVASRSAASLLTVFLAVVLSA